MHHFDFIVWNLLENPICLKSVKMTMRNCDKFQNFMNWLIVSVFSLCAQWVPEQSEFGPWHEIFNNVVCATSKVSHQPAHSRSMIRAFASRLIILSLLSYRPNIIWRFSVSKGGCTGSSEPTLVKMPHCWKSHVAAHFFMRTESFRDAKPYYWISHGTA